jgi:hypothetical protein
VSNPVDKLAAPKKDMDGRQALWSMIKSGYLHSHPFPSFGWPSEMGQAIVDAASGSDRRCLLASWLNISETRRVLCCRATACPCLSNPNRWASFCNAMLDYAAWRQKTVVKIAPLTVLTGMRRKGFSRPEIKRSLVNPETVPSWRRMHPGNQGGLQARLLLPFGEGNRFPGIMKIVRNRFCIVYWEASVLFEGWTEVISA